MRQANPNTKFHYEDIIPEPFELNNALWGAHIGNNFDRLLAVDGTIFFNPIPPGFSYEDVTKRIYYLPLDVYEFHTMPIIQIMTSIDYDYTIATTLVSRSSETGWTLNGGPVSSSDEIFVAYIDSINQPQPFPAEQLIRLGLSQDELMLVRSMRFKDRTTYGDTTRWMYEFNCSRGWSPYTGSDSYTGVEKIYSVDYSDISATVLNYTAGTYELNPPHAQVVVDGQSAIFTWGNSSSGTLYYKIFGV
jgi:hypothetical protein